MVIHLILVALTTLVINIPFGYWREGVKKFSPFWFIAVHGAVPLVVLMRRNTEVGNAWYTYPPMILCYFGGQFIGSRYRRSKVAAQAALETAKDA
ncbi:MAG: hypothetical protein ACI9UK_002099 [Candidatus Krumholzibacteriia bacterium]